MKKLFTSIVFGLVLSGVINAQVVTGYIDARDECAQETEMRDAEYPPTEEYLSLQEALSYFYAGCYQTCRYMPDLHDAFGERSIDLMSDLWSGDAAMPRAQYGWFYYDEQVNLENRALTVWTYYYHWIYVINKAIIHFPSAPTEDSGSFAQLIALRGYIYSRLVNFFGDRSDDALCCPIYTEDNYQTRIERFNTREEVCARAIADLEDALEMMQSANFVRSDKLYLDANVVRGLLAQTYLNAAVGSAAHENEYLTQALSYARDVINSAVYTILPGSELLTTGFNNAESANWMWGLTVDSVYLGALKSFFPHVDIYTYGYASIGDIKAIDQVLFESIPSWDKRKSWWNNYYDAYINSSNYTLKNQAKMFKLVPDGKFFSAATNVVGDDKEWLSDDVFMRVEMLYLVASEAALRLGDLALAQSYLFALTDERYKEGEEASYSEWKASLTSAEKIQEQIIYNWRIEMWGEGYAYETMRRWNHARTRGNNHSYKLGVTVTADDIIANYKVPYPYLEDSLGNRTLYVTGEEVAVTFQVEGCDEPQGVYTCMAGDALMFYVPGEETRRIQWTVIGEKTDTVIAEYIVLAITGDLTVIADLNFIDAVPTVQVKRVDAQKVLRNNQVVIVNGNKTYTLSGQLIDAKKPEE